MSEPKKQELANVQAQNLSLVGAADLAKLVERPAEETLVVHGTVIHCTDSGYYSLNDLHKASGEDDSQRPYAFLRTKDAKDSIEAMKQLGVENAYETIIGGVDQGTYAHKWLAYSYAAYLDKTFGLKTIRILDKVTDFQINKIQSLYEGAIAQVGLEQAEKIKTVAELEELQKDLEWQAEATNKFYLENEDLKRKLVDAHSRSPKKRGESLAVAEEVAISGYAQASEQLRDALGWLHISRESLLRVVSSLPKDVSRATTNAKDALERLNSAIRAIDPDSLT